MKGDFFCREIRLLVSIGFGDKVLFLFSFLFIRDSKSRIVFVFFVWFFVVVNVIGSWNCKLEFEVYIILVSVFFGFDG